LATNPQLKLRAIVSSAAGAGETASPGSGAGVGWITGNGATAPPWPSRFSRSFPG